MIRLVAFVLPLGLDSFAVATALGASGLTGPRDRLRVSLIFVVFEAGMPLIGLAAGAALARAVGAVADYLGGAAVIGLGIFMLAADDGDNERAGQIAGTRGLAIIGLGISISLDELAIGFSLGLVRLPVLPVIAAIGVQALLASQAGLALGRRISEHLRERAGQAAAIALILLGGYLLTQHLITR
jgi:putative Mn2+ efflux pump MntP